jgi:hypothetical protein
VTAANQRARNVRSSDRTAPCFLENRFQRDIDSETLQALDDILRAYQAVIAKSHEMMLDFFAIGDVKCEEMNFPRPVMSAQLDAWNHADSERFRCELSFLKSGERVVISQCNRSQPGVARSSNDCGGRKSPIRSRRVHMKIDLAGLAVRLPGCHVL